MKRLAVGEPAPDFALPDPEGNLVKLADFSGKKLLLYFYPKADTPGCTRQACQVRDAREELAQAGVAAVGVSPDPPEAQKKFAGKYGLSFPLLSDPDHQVARSYGVWGPKTRFGKKTEGVIRSAFLIDEGGSILGAWYNIKPEDTVPRVLKALGRH